MIVECCVCKRWKKNGRWVEATRNERTFTHSVLAISHGFCKECFVAYLRKEITMIVECCVCKRRKNNGRWTKATREERTLAVSHGYCKECFIAYLKKEGFSEDEVNRLSAEIE